MQTPVKLRFSLEFTDLRKLSTLIQPELYQFLSRFFTYLCNTHNLKNISKVHGWIQLILRGGEKISLPHAFVFFENEGTSLTSVSTNPSL